MKKSIVILSALSVFGSLQFVSAGDVTGKVTLKGTPPAEMALRLDETCGKMHPDGETTHKYVVSKDGGLGNVLVYVSKGAEGKGSVPTQSVELNQVGCTYQPYLSAVMVGQQVKIKNSDPVMHNVHAMPQVDGNTEFNFGQPNQGMVDDATFAKKITKKEVVVKLMCNVHEWMLAYVAVLDNPYFAVTDKDGNFTIKGLPAGDYTLTAYHVKTHGRNSTGVTQAVKVEGDKAATANFTVELPAAK